MVTSKSNGGLRLCTLKEQNLSLLIKWWSRLINEVDILWKMVIVYNLKKTHFLYCSENIKWCMVQYIQGSEVSF